LTNAAQSREEITKQIIQIIAKEGMIDEARVTPEATLTSLEIDSMAIVMILMSIEEKFNVYIPMDGSMSEVNNLQGLIDALIERIQKQHA
jgi:acyl carrier protein